MGKASNRKRLGRTSVSPVQSMTRLGLTIACSRVAEPEVFVLCASALKCFLLGDLKRGATFIANIEQAGYSVFDFQISSLDTANVAVDFASWTWMHDQPDLVRWLATKAIAEDRANSTSLFPFLSQAMECLEEGSASFQVAREIFQQYARFCARQFGFEELSEFYDLLPPHALSVMKNAVEETRAMFERESLCTHINTPDAQHAPPVQPLDKSLRL